jgi:hypothetical protein
MSIAKEMDNSELMEMFFAKLAKASKRVIDETMTGNNIPGQILQPGKLIASGVLAEKALKAAKTKLL